MRPFGKFRSFRRKLAYALCLTLVLSIYVLPFFAPDPALSAGQRRGIISEGKMMLGVPYSQLNCSEFTRLAYGRGAGVWMPANYVSQRYYGYRAPRLKKGDLLTYNNHVGIFYGYDRQGDGQILHSSTYYDRVVVSETKYLNGYLGARRIR